MAKKDQLQHVLIPEHSKLSEKEKKELFEKYNIDLKELPKISIKDPAIRHLEVKERDIIKIVRKSMTAGTTVFYRGVVND
jgi:DNA-directed RNA polymerase subunit H